MTLPITPEAGQHIKCIFRNGTIVEGIVEEWISKHSTVINLRSLSDESLLIILHPMDDLMMIKIMPDPSEDIESPTSKDREKQIEEVVEKIRKEKLLTLPFKDQIRSKLQEIVVASPDQELQDVAISELRDLAREQDRQILVDKIKEHFPGGVGKSNYAAQANVVLDRKPYGQS